MTFYNMSIDTPKVLIVCTCSLHDIMAIGEDSFYFVNYYDFNWMLEYMFGICSGNVGFYDGTRGSIIVPKMRSPLGINVSPNGK